jgi:nucleotide-binding universal stress UspA family protein
MSGNGPLLLAYDGTRASDQALHEAGALFNGREALVVVVWKAGLAFDLLESVEGLPPAPLDVRTALEVDESLYERARQAAWQAAEAARRLGLQAEPLVVADDPDTPVAETLVRIASERDAQVLVAGAHLHSGMLGRTTRDLIREAPCPTLLTRDQPS